MNTTNNLDDNLVSQNIVVSQNVVPVILCGGNGTRLWPLSRESYPKQFIKLANEPYSMLQRTIRRLLPEYKPSILVCNHQHQFLLSQQLEEIDYQADTILLEPCSRNTAPAIALAAKQALDSYPDPILLILPTDHAIEDIEKYQQIIDNSTSLAEEDYLVTFGIKPSEASTGFGYIKKGKSINQSSAMVDRFYEKPDALEAKKFLENKDYMWNSGIFMVKAKHLLAELDNHCPEVLQRVEESMKYQLSNGKVVNVNEEFFQKSPAISFDKAVMEKTRMAVVVKLNVGWSDMGTWSSILEKGNKDENGNYLEGDVICIDSKNSLVKSSSRLVSLIGMEDVIVVETKDVVLVARKHSEDKIKDVFDDLIFSNRDEHISNREVYRPWGKYDSIDNGKRFKVKHITVKAGEKLSVQSHFHRAEHWVVVSGTAIVTLDDKTKLLTENDSIYIPLGVIHSLENPGKVPLELIEIQTGAYLGEDDIVRIEDKYGRL